MPPRPPLPATRRVHRTPAASLAILLAALACGPTTQTEATRENGKSGALRTIDIGAKDYEAKEVTLARGSSQGPRVVETIHPGWITVDNPPMPVTPIPLWEPQAVARVFRDHCADCHYPFHFKENVEFNRARVLASVRAEGGARPMPPVGRNPNHTTFRNTEAGLTLIAWLEGRALPTPSASPNATATATAAATATPSPSPWTYDDVKSIVQSTCVAGCHVSGGGASHAPLDTLAAVQPHRRDMSARIRSGNMPKAAMPPRAFPSAADKAKLLDWLDSGADLM